MTTQPSITATKELIADYPKCELDITFTEEQHKVWATLFERQYPALEEMACQEYLEGFHILNMNPQRIPSLDDINSKIYPETTWRVERTDVRYSDSIPWYHKFEKKIFMITTYMRGWHEMDFTPEPDMFHDVFGHQPYLAIKAYTDMFDMFTLAFLKATPEERDCIKSLAFYSYEFGLVKEKGELKLFGAGLLSGYEEGRKALAGKIPIIPYTFEEVTKYPKVVWDYNQRLFVFESLEALKEELNRFLAPIASRETYAFHNREQMEDSQITD